MGKGERDLTKGTLEPRPLAKRCEQNWKSTPNGELNRKVCSTAAAQLREVCFSRISGKKSVARLDSSFACDSSIRLRLVCSLGAKRDNGKRARSDK